MQIRRASYGMAIRHRRGRVRPVQIAPPAVTRPLGGRGPTNPVRLSVARELGRDIDGAWWPRVDRITNELPELVAILTPMLGHVVSINVNWPPLERPPDFNWPGWEHKRQHVMTVSGGKANANLLIIPYATHSALALMLLRGAADLPIDAADRTKPAFLTACAILRAAHRQCGQSGTQIPEAVTDPAGLPARGSRTPS